MKPVLHRYIIEVDPSEVNTSVVNRTRLMLLAGVPIERITFASIQGRNPLSGLERIEFRLFVDAEKPTHTSNQ